MGYNNGIVPDIKVEQQCRLYFDDEMADDLPKYVVDKAIERFLCDKDMVDADDIASMVMMSVPKNSPATHEKVYDFVKTFRLNITNADVERPAMEGVNCHG